MHKRTMHKKIMFIFLMLPAFFFSGCWDVEEVNIRALPNTLFFDTGQKEKVQLGIDMHVAGTLLPPVYEMEQQFEKNHGVLYAEGESAVEAWSKLQTMTSRNIFFGQLRAIILSDKFARQNIEGALDIIGRVPFVSLDTHLLITKDDPKELVDTKNRSNFIPGNYIEQYFQSPYKKMLATPITIFEVFSRIDNQTSDPYFPMITTQQGNYVITGTALFSGNKMVGELNKPETYMFSLLNGGSTGFLSIPSGDNQVISYLQMHSDNKIVPRYNTERNLYFEIYIKIEAMIAETNPYQGPLSVEDKKELDQTAEVYLKQQIETLLAKLQKLNADPVGFGEKLRSKYPDLWEKTDWHKEYQNTKFKVEVKFNTKKTGLFR